MESGTPGVGSRVVEFVVTALSWLLLILTFPVTIFFCFKVVQQYERAVIFRMGRTKPGGSKGIFFILPCIESFVKV